ncbi:hypothetical protein [Paraburkholderia sp. SIMBA_030]
MREKRLLLDVLAQADPRLLDEVRVIVSSYFSRHPDLLALDAPESKAGA